MMRSRSSSVKRESQNSTPTTGAIAPPAGTNVLFDVWLVSRATSGALDAALAASGLNADEFAIYSVLTTTESMTPTELARWMSAPLTSISSYVKRFESRGHITRVPNPRDGRSYRIRLTTAGHATHQTAGKLFQPVLEHVERTLDKPPPDVRTALQSLYRALPTA